MTQCRLLLCFGLHYVPTQSLKLGREFDVTDSISPHPHPPLPPHLLLQMFFLKMFRLHSHHFYAQSTLIAMRQHVMRGVRVSNLLTVLIW